MAVVVAGIGLAVEFLAASPVTAAVPQGFVLQDMPSGQTSSLTDFAYTPDGSYFTTGKNGRIAWVSASGAAKTLANVSVETTNDLGLTGIAVASDYPTSKKIYTSRAVNLAGQWTLRLSVFTVTGTSEPTGVTAEQILFDLPAHSDSHSINGIQVAPDGSLWVGMGDSADYRVIDTLALRALDINQGYGKILHILPSGAGVPGNPYYDSANPFSWKSRVYASGFRNPFRFSLDPATGSPITSDVGWYTTEEINMVRPGASYGWPCWEGNDRAPGYRDMAACVGVGNAAPLVSYPHGPMGSSAVGGVVYTGTSYPAAYRGAYFFGDYTSNRVYTITYDTQGKLTRGPEADGFISGNGAPVKFGTTPGGDIVYADIIGSVLKRIKYAPGNRAPVAVATTQTNPSTRTVVFDGSSSSDPDGDSLTYSWDFGDGTTGSGPTVSHTYAAPGTSPLTATLTVRDLIGATHTVSLKVVPANHTPAITLNTPPAGTVFKVGDAVSLNATATDQEDGTLTPHWKTTMVHCGAGGCHNHPGAEFDGPTYSRAFEDHGDDTSLVITASAADRFGVVTQKTYTAMPKLRTLTINSTVPAAIHVNGTAQTTALITAGARVSLTAPVTATDGVASFETWENGDPRERLITMPDANLSVKATYLTPIDRRYNGEAALRTTIGTPIAPEAGDMTLRYRDYTQGRMYWTPRAGVHEMHGSILATYKAAGAHPSIGEPITDETATPDGVGRYNHFYGTIHTGPASIYWTPSTGAHLVYGHIRELWSSMGWEGSPHGYPTSSEATTPNGRARFNNFQNGGIYWTAAGGAKSVYGAIYQKWAAYGWEQGFLGLPLTNETSTPDGIGRYNHFEGGSVYWTPATLAHEVHGSIKARWAALGWERSYLGYPTSDEFSISGGRRSNFQNGYITWNATTGQVIDRRY